MPQDCLCIRRKDNAKIPVIKLQAMVEKMEAIAAQHGELDARTLVHKHQDWLVHADC